MAPAVPLIEHPEDLAQFADDMAQLGKLTAKSLAIQYLDQNLDSDAWEGTFDEAVEAFIPQVRYYA